MAEGFDQSYILPNSDYFSDLDDNELQLKENIVFFMNMGLNQTEIGKNLGVCRNTVAKYMKKFNIDKKQRFSAVSDEMLDEIMFFIVQENPLWGERLVSGYLKSINIEVQRDRVRDSMRRIDPEGVEQRRRGALHRRQYIVPHFNFIWHIDGHHKLIRWRLVVHGAVDGYSRIPVYLKCSNNNRAETVFQCFLEAINIYGCPDRVRSDCGGENVDVRDFMIQRNGNYGFVSGRSVHNQRIERLWRDVYHRVLVRYRDLFMELESSYLLNPIDELDLFCLHWIYVPVINLHLQQFQNTWNNHKIRTAGNKTPLQLMLESMGLIDNDSEQQQEQVPEYFNQLNDRDDAVYVPEIMTVNDHLLQELQVRFPQESNVHNIYFYMNGNVYSVLREYMRSQLA